MFMVLKQLVEDFEVRINIDALALVYELHSRVGAYAQWNRSDILNFSGCESFRSFPLKHCEVRRQPPGFTLVHFGNDLASQIHVVLVKRSEVL